MRPVSDRFLRSLRGSHRMVSEVRVVDAGQTGVNPSGASVLVLDGDVQVDGTAQIRSTVEITVGGAGMWPTSAADLLAPYGRELFVRRGIRYSGGVTEWVSLGYHRIYSPEQDDAPDGPIRVSGRDRMSGIVDGRLVAPVRFGGSVTYGQVLSTLVSDIYPWATIEWDDNTSDQQIGRAILAEEDRHGFLNDLVMSVGKIWYWDHRGVLVVRTPPALSEPVWTVDYGRDGVLLSLSRRLTREDVFNGVVATGESAGTGRPVRAVVVDNNPSSPTYWYGPFGKVPTFFASPLITKPAQADIAAASMLRAQIGLPYSVDLSSIPNPALEPYDPIRVTYPGRTEVHVLDRITVPLVAERALTASTREQSMVLLGSL